jgi:hypothetical protein
MPPAFSSRSVPRKPSGNSPISSQVVMRAPMNRMADWITSVQMTAAMPPSIV